jgi:uncharacterized membrane protein
VKALGAIAERLPPSSPASPVLWFAVLGAPLAYVLQMGLGYWLAEAKCSPTGGMWGISLAAWGIVVGAVSATVALAAGLTALWLFRRTGDYKDAPPSGRTAFLGVVGMTVSSLFLALILMSAAGILTYQVCNQS